MNNKGFTLIELVAIVLVIAAIFLVSFPNLLNMSKADEEKKYDNMVENLCLAGESYIYANVDDFQQLSIVNSTIEISIEELIIYGNVDSDLKNPNTNESVENDTLIFRVLSDNTLDCNYKEN